MKNVNRKGSSIIFKTLLLLAFLFQSTFIFPNYTKITDPCQPLLNVTKTNQTSDTVSFSWNDSGSGITYEIWFTRAEDGYVSPVSTTNGCSINFTRLSAGTYTFYFSKICKIGTSTAIVIDDLMMG